ncbi:MAG: GNAT family N-acetyltransferase [Clostridia bacterium]|nr:GNAT family N-acetyltransferase [Clostridia bacterium]
MDFELIKKYSDNALVMTALSESGEKMASGSFVLRDIRFGGQYVRALTVCGLETKPQFRRQGIVRRMMSEGENYGRENGAFLSVLHPFSFSFYRKFGYERVSDTVIIKFPLSTIDFIPYYRGLKPLTNELIPAFIEYFDRFSENRNLMFRRDPERIDVNNTYVLCENGRISGHVVIDNKVHFDGVNRNDPDGLFIRQLGYLSPEALGCILGFFRMYEGEQKEVIICDAGPLPEVDSFLKHYMETSYVIRPDIMAKVLDTEKALSNARYSYGSAQFTVYVVDNDKRIGGKYCVEYCDGRGNAKKAGDSIDIDEDADIVLSPMALSKLLFGYDSFTCETAAYLPGVKVTAASYKALNAFPKQINGWFEHF